MSIVVLVIVARYRKEKLDISIFHIASFHYNATIQPNNDFLQSTLVDLDLFIIQGIQTKNRMIKKNKLVLEADI